MLHRQFCMSLIFLHQLQEVARPAPTADEDLVGDAMTSAAAATTASAPRQSGSLPGRGGRQGAGAQPRQHGEAPPHLRHQRQHSGLQVRVLGGYYQLGMPLKQAMGTRCVGVLDHTVRVTSQSGNLLAFKDRPCCAWLPESEACELAG